METPAAATVTATVFPSSADPFKPSIFLGRSIELAFRSNFQISSKNHECTDYYCPTCKAKFDFELSDSEKSQPKVKLTCLEGESPPRNSLTEMLIFQSQWIGERNCCSC
ncbi:uncharacterized protein LOC133289390 [Gastrolobium bilobum]|uniref:uncharacterized protein LOC133289390 n=1 Tax=Gastrolobium bilobum TaxID=150636 RepID=UPI002AB0021B|nr:uncharacterized protein LOC133289390 [Gastrolobium bilobum]